MNCIEQSAHAESMHGGEAEADRRSAEEVGGSDITSDVVIRSLMDMLFMPAGMIQLQERAFAADLLQQVVQAAGEEARRALSDRVAGLSEVPASLVRWMLTEFSDDALAPLLRDGICVSDTDLVALIRDGCPSRLELIAGRSHLPGVACAAIAEAGDLAALSTMLSNPAARIDEPTLAALSVRALEEPALRDLVVMRPELTPSCALALFWVLGTRGRAQVLRRFLTDCRILPQVLVMAKPAGDLISSALRCTRDAAGGDRAASGTPPATGRAAVGEFLCAIETGNTAEIARHIERLGLVGGAAAERIAADRGGEALAVACKVAGVSRFNFSSACKAWRQAHQDHRDEVAGSDELQVVFDTLSFKQARMALTYWNWQATGSGPYLAFADGADVEARSAA